MKDYHINIFFIDEDGMYVADIPDLEFRSAFGSTPERRSPRFSASRKRGSPPRGHPEDRSRSLVHLDEVLAALR